MENANTMIVNEGAQSGTVHLPTMGESFEGSKIVSATYARDVTYPTNAKSFANPTSEIDIVNYLRRPFKFAAGTISEPTQGLVYSAPIFPNICNNALVNPKIFGYCGIRAKVVFRLQINSNPFQQCILIMNLRPFADDCQQRYSNAYSYVQLPHVQMDISHDTEATLEIPYVSPLPYYNRINTSGNVGNIEIHRYTPFRTGEGSTSCSYTLWCHMEEIELVMPIAQMGDIYEAQAGISEKEQSKSGPVSLGLRKIEKSAAILGGVPLLSSFAGVVGWASSIGRKVADIWGWSKPLNVNPITRMNVLESGYDPNADGLENARSLAVFSNPTVSIDPGIFNSAHDQMSIPYLVTKYGYVGIYAWTSSPPSTKLIEMDIGPSKACRARTSRVVSDPAPLCYINQMFALYKGSVRVKLKFSKNDYYSGRLLLTFCPQVTNGATPSVTYADASELLLREILDVRECSEFTYVLPYMSTNGYTKRDDCYGRMTLWVLDSLSAPATVAGTIDVILEMSGTEDFEFAVPSSGYMAPITEINDDYIPVAQMGDFGSLDCLEPTPVGGAKDFSLPTSALCVGEEVKSLKQMLLRTSLALTATYGTMVSPAQFYIFQLDPHVPFARTTAYINNAQTGAFGSDIFSIVSAMYAMSRGGVVLRYKTEGAGGQRMVVLEPNTFTSASDPVTKSFRILTTSVAADPGVLYNRCGVIYPSNDAKLVSVLTPQYNNAPARLVAPGAQDGPSDIASTYTTPSVLSGRYYVSLHVNAIPSGTNDIWTVSIYRQASEDFHLGFFTYSPSFMVSADAA